MAQLKSPGVGISETAQSGGASGPALSTVAAFIGLAQKGPVGKAVQCSNLTEFNATFGADTVGYLRKAANALWAPGNAPGAAAYFIRQAHYANVDDATTLAAKKASANFQTAASVNALTVTATSEGTWGNSLKPQVTPGTGNSFTLDIYETVNGVDTLRKSYTNVTLDTVEAAVNGVDAYITVDSLVSATPMAAAQTALTGGDDGLTGLTDADYIGSSVIRSGIYALNTVAGKLLVAVPGIATKTVAQAVDGWCANRGDSYWFGDCPMGTYYADAVTYRQTTLGLNTSYGELWWPNLMVNGVEVPISPYKIAAQIRTDAAVNGCHQVAAGAIYGSFYGYTDTASDLWKDVEVRNALDQAQVNTLNVIQGSVVFWGANTLDTTGTFPYSNERRVFQDAEARVRENVIIDVFQGNNESLWKTLRRKVREQIEPIWRAGGLRGAKFEDACDIKIDSETNPDPNSAEVHGQIGLATSRPGLFFYFDFYRKS